MKSEQKKTEAKKRETKPERLLQVEDLGRVVGGQNCYVGTRTGTM